MGVCWLHCILCSRTDVHCVKESQAQLDRKHYVAIVSAVHKSHALSTLLKLFLEIQIQC